MNKEVTGAVFLGKFGSTASHLTHAQQHPIHLLLRVFDRMRRDSVPPLCRLVLLALVAECAVDTDNAVIGAASLEGLSRATGIRVGEVLRAIDELTGRQWLLATEEMSCDVDVATPYRVRLDGRAWRKDEQS